MVSKEDLQIAFREVKVEIAELRGNMDTRFAEAKADMAGQFQTLYRRLWVMGLGGITDGRRCELIRSNPGSWNESGRYALAKKATSREDLYDNQ